MPKQNNPELSTLYAVGCIVTLGVSVAFYLNDGFKLEKKDLTKLMNDFFRENRSSVIQTSGAVSISLLTGWFNRATIIENNNEMKIERHKKLTYESMQEHSEQIDQALSEGDYLSAANHCSQVSEILGELYVHYQHKSLQQKISSFVYKQARVLYYKKDYEAAILIITQRLENKDLPKESREYVDLLSLRGLIYFKQSFLINLTTITESDRLLKISGRDFEEAYKIYPNNAVYFYIKFIREEYDAIVDYIPIKGFNPKHIFALNVENELQENIHLLFAEACFRNKAWAKAISFYEYHLNNITDVECSQFMELFAINLNCIKAYAKLITANEDHNIPLKRITKSDEIETNETNSRLHLIDSEENRDNVKAIVIERFEAANNFLDCKLIINDNPAQNYIQHANLAHAYNLLAKAFNQYNVSPHDLNVPCESKWKKAIETHQIKAHEEKAKIITSRKTWYGYFFENKVGSMLQQVTSMQSSP